MGKIKQWIIVKVLTWLVLEVAKKDVMKRLIPIVIKKTSLSPDLVKSQLKFLFTDWIKEIEEA